MAHVRRIQRENGHVSYVVKWRMEGRRQCNLCRVRDCVNPNHLEPVTCKENVYRSPIAPGAINGRKTHCPSGHEYSPENTYVHLRYGKYPGRLCRTCQREHSRRAYQKARGMSNG